MTAQRLLGKKCIVTGGSSGIGLAIGRRFALEGAQKVILVGRNKEKLGKLQSAHQKEGLKGIEYAAGDVALEECWIALKDLMPEMDVLVNAAGIAQSTVLTRTTVEMMDEIMATNLKGVMLGCKFMAVNMARKHYIRSSKDGGDTPCVINVSSLLALKGGKGATIYAATKAGVIGLTRAMVAETGPRPLRVNVIVPGYIETPMIEGFNDQHRTGVTNQIPLRRFGTPEEVADAVVFLASNQYANNCVLNLDGGLSAF